MNIGRFTLFVFFLGLWSQTSKAQLAIEASGSYLMDKQFNSSGGFGLKYGFKKWDLRGIFDFYIPMENTKWSTTEVNNSSETKQARFQSFSIYTRRYFGSRDMAFGGLFISVGATMGQLYQNAYTINYAADNSIISTKKWENKEFHALASVSAGYEIDMRNGFYFTPEILYRYSINQITTPYNGAYTAGKSYPLFSLIFTYRLGDGNCDNNPFRKTFTRSYRTW